MTKEPTLLEAAEALLADTNEVHGPDGFWRNELGAEPVDNLRAAVDREKAKPAPDERPMLRELRDRICEVPTPGSRWAEKKRVVSMGAWRECINERNRVLRLVDELLARAPSAPEPAARIVRVWLTRDNPNGGSDE